MAGETEISDTQSAKTNRGSGGAPTALDKLAGGDGTIIAAGVPEGYDAFLLGAIARRLPIDTDYPQAVLHIARDGQRLEELKAQIEFFAPNAEIMVFPAWDCVPYDRVSPDSEIESRRIATLARIAHAKPGKPAFIVLTTVNAMLQRVPPLDAIRKSAVRLAAGNRLGMEQVIQRLEASGFHRTGTVMEPGEYAVRGGILDLFAPGHARPVRLDFFGDTLESIRQFDPVTQRTQAARDQITLLPISELPTAQSAIKNFRQRYVEMFGADRGDDPLYEAVSTGARYPGVEHWLPLFYERMETLFDYLPNAVITVDHLGEDAKARRLETIADHYEARKEGLEQKSFGAPPYKPLPPEMLYLTSDEWEEALGRNKVRLFTPFPQPDMRGVVQIDFRGKHGRSFALERAESSEKLMPALAEHIRALRSLGKRTIVACWTNGARERLGNMIAAQGLDRIAKVANIAEARKAEKAALSFALLGLESGFETPDLAIIAEQDILGDRLIRRRKAKKASDVLVEASSLAPGDLMVHADHGIGRFIGLKTIDAAGAPHDCVELEYSGGDKLFLPIENMELLTRYGSDDAANLDKLGGAAWQSRKARLKQRIREMAEELIKVAAARETRPAPIFVAPDGAYTEFLARFPYEETDDQLASIDAVAEDLAKGRPMDRLICGDVGFGKTEVALRAAFIAVMEGKQVAVVVPTTLLARQHHKTFVDRFQGFPVKIGRASRLVPAKELTQMREGLKSGQIDIVVGTHALLAKSIEFKDLGLLIIDEEQHFGVGHKERLKQIREDVHVLTLTATPIPRTLQLALTGVREMSVIATPPVDRLAVRTFITPFDPVILREALLRERYRGGQSFYVVPRISDLDEVGAFLRENVPEIRFMQAHGQMPPTQLEDIMSAFYDKEFDVLLSTTIVESGLDIPTANTLIVHRADMFGLGQLYQLRGRVGRSKTRAYAMFTMPANGKITPQAEKRLKILHSLDSLGAGFTLASHDLDLRGAGNLLGDEQSGHIKEVGYELYQSMLEEAVQRLKEQGAEEQEEQWSPTINVGMPVLLPEAYVPDLQVRLGLYRRLSGLRESADVENFASELADRFGPLPEEVKHLLTVVQIKNYCRRAGVAQVDAGPKGALVTFRNKKFSNPQGLVTFMHEQGANVKLQPDHKLVFRADWEDGVERLKGARSLVRELADIASGKKEAAPVAPAAPTGAAHELRIALPQKKTPAPPPPPSKPALPKVPVMKTLHGVSYKGKGWKR